MKFRLQRSSAALAAALVGAALALGGRPATAGSTTDLVLSNWKFTPATVVAHVGEETTLRLKSSEGVHGIESEALGIPKTVLPPDKVVEVTFTPKKAGTYDVHCAIMCGEGHEKMALVVKVQN